MTWTWYNLVGIHLFQTHPVVYPSFFPWISKPQVEEHLHGQQMSHRSQANSHCDHCAQQQQQVLVLWQTAASFVDDHSTLMFVSPPHLHQPPWLSCSMVHWCAFNETWASRSPVYIPQNPKKLSKKPTRSVKELTTPRLLAISLEMSPNSYESLPINFATWLLCKWFTPTYCSIFAPTV